EFEQEETEKTERDFVLRFLGSSCSAQTKELLKFSFACRPRWRGGEFAARFRSSWLDPIAPLCRGRNRAWRLVACSCRCRKERPGPSPRSPLPPCTRASERVAVAAALL